MKSYDRVIRADLYDSNRYLDLPSDTHRLTYNTLLHLADDFGNFQGDTRTLWRYLRERTQIKHEGDAIEVLSRLCDVDLLRRYAVGSDGYFFHIPRFSTYRTYISRRVPASPWDDPEIEARALRYKDYDVARRKIRQQEKQALTYKPESGSAQVPSKPESGSAQVALRPETDLRLETGKGKGTGTNSLPSGESTPDPFKDFGDKLQSWTEQHQSGATPPERTISSERANLTERTNQWERATEPERTKPSERATSSESTTLRERAVTSESANKAERLLRRKQPLSEIDPDLILSPEWRAEALAIDPRMDVDREFQKFKDRNIAKGQKYRIWIAAWRNWCRRAPEFAPNGKPQQQQAITEAEMQDLYAYAQRNESSIE